MESQMKHQKHLRDKKMKCERFSTQLISEPVYMACACRRLSESEGCYVGVALSYEYGSDLERPSFLFLGSVIVK